MDASANNECGICLGEWTSQVKLPCGHSFCADCLSGWKSKYSGRPSREQQRRRCPLCRGAIPPSQDQIENMKMFKELMKNRSSPNYEMYARDVEQFEAEYGEDWEGTMIEYDKYFVRLPTYVYKAALDGNFRTVLQWLNKGNVKERVNAKCEDGGNVGLLFAAAENQRHDLLNCLLLNGADVNNLDSVGISVLSMVGDHLQATRSLLSWGAELFEEGKQMTKKRTLIFCEELSERGNVAIAKLMSSELGGRRCEIVSTAKNTRGDLVGKTCVVEEYIKKSNQYKVKMEFTSEVLLLGVDDLKRRDRTPQDPGYYVECKNNRLIRHDFKSNEECQAFLANLGADDDVAEVDPDAEAKAEQAAADLLAELGLEDLDGPGSNTSKTEKPTSSGKKKKRGGKKKGRK